MQEIALWADHRSRERGVVWMQVVEKTCPRVGLVFLRWSVVFNEGEGEGEGEGYEIGRAHV